MRVVEVYGDRFMDSLEKLEALGESSGERILVRGVDADEYVVRKAVGFLENRGWVVGWELQVTDEAVVKRMLGQD